MGPVWMIEADIYRLKKALLEADPDKKMQLVIRLRNTEASLNRRLFDTPIDPSLSKPTTG